MRKTDTILILSYSSKKKKKKENIFPPNITHDEKLTGNSFRFIHPFLSVSVSVPIQYEYKKDQSGTPFAFLEKRKKTPPSSVGF